MRNIDIVIRKDDKTPSKCASIIVALFLNLFLKYGSVSKGKGKQRNRKVEKKEKVRES